MAIEVSAKELGESFKGLKVLVIGDVMIDSYVWGKSNRMSPEAPVPIVEVESRELRLGGAANVALNLKSLGAEPIICSAIGNDNKAQDFLNLLTAQQLRSDRILLSENRVTTIKNRIFSSSKQVIRVDEESTNILSETELQTLISKITDILHEIDLIIFEDYDKGSITPELIEYTVQKAKISGIPIAVDPKKRNFFEYKDVTLFKPNLKEVNEALDINLISDKKELDDAHAVLAEKLGHKNSLVTLSEKGIYYASENGSDLLPTYEREIEDVSGAGDTVISTAALCLVAGLSIESIAKISNLAGGLVCEKIGVKPIELNSLIAEIEKHNIPLTKIEKTKRH